MSATGSLSGSRRSTLRWCASPWTNTSGCPAARPRRRGRTRSRRRRSARAQWRPGASSAPRSTRRAIRPAPRRCGRRAPSAPKPTPSTTNPAITSTCCSICRPSEASDGPSDSISIARRDGRHAERARWHSRRPPTARRPRRRSRCGPPTVGVATLTTASDPSREIAGATYTPKPPSNAAPIGSPCPPRGRRLTRRGPRSHLSPTTERSAFADTPSGTSTCPWAEPSSPSLHRPSVPRGGGPG